MGFALAFPAKPFKRSVVPEVNIGPRDRTKYFARLIGDRSFTSSAQSPSEPGSHRSAKRAGPEFAIATARGRLILFCVDPEKPKALRLGH
jgi:hypothetical protein